MQADRAFSQYQMANSLAWIACPKIRKVYEHIQNGSIRSFALDNLLCNCPA